MPRIDGGVKRRQEPFHQVLRGLIALVLPERCGWCGKSVDQPGYCPTCLAKLARHRRQCRRCGVPFAGDDVCGRCQWSPSPVDETIAPFKYAPPVSDAIHHLKYHRKLACGRDLGHLLARELETRSCWLPDVLVPVPLHWRRRLHRGFNQSLEIAQPVSRALDIPIDTRLVTRRVHTMPQIGLTPQRRRGNLQRAFQASPGSKPRSVAIVDEVVTSGATVSELAGCLRRSGVERILVWAIARV